MDPLSSVLRSVKLTGGVFLDGRFTAPWCVYSGVTPRDCRPFLAQPTQVIAYHYVAEGSMLVLVDEDPPLEISAGEIVLLPRNDPHVVASDRNLRPVAIDDLVRPAEDGGFGRIEFGGGGALTRLVCGFLGSEEARNPLIATLPRALKLPVERAASRDWIEASLRLAARELAAGPAAAAPLVSRLAELLFVEAVRSYAASLPADRKGWFKALDDPYVGRALALIHNDLRRDWTTETLAREVALSRSAFAERFAAAVGMPPMRYVTYWRLQLAKRELEEGRKPLAQIAFDAGYEAEAAFNRAFKREFGEPPARWRSIRQAAPPAGEKAASSVSST